MWNVVRRWDSQVFEWACLTRHMRGLRIFSRVRPRSHPMAPFERYNTSVFFAGTCVWRISVQHGFIGLRMPANFGGDFLTSWMDCIPCGEASLHISGGDAEVLAWHVYKSRWELAAARLGNLLLHQDSLRSQLTCPR